MPENHLSVGIFYVNTLLFTLESQAIKFNEKDIISFNVTDSIDGDSARGILEGPTKESVRPLLKWTTYSKAVK
jgi:lipopolysaccharide transport system ATP-binding protein